MIELRNRLKTDNLSDDADVSGFVEYLTLVVSWMVECWRIDALVRGRSMSCESPPWLWKLDIFNIMSSLVGGYATMGVFEWTYYELFVDVYHQSVTYTTELDYVYDCVC